MKATAKVKAHKVRATLRDRKRCYNGHRLAEDTVDHYGKGGYRKSEHTKPAQVRWMGCRLCRKDARARWRIKNAQRLVAARNAERKAARAALQAARPKAGKVARKAANGKPASGRAMFSHKDAGKGTVKAA